MGIRWSPDYRRLCKIKTCSRWWMVWESMYCIVCLHLRKRYIINAIFITLLISCQFFMSFQNPILCPNNYTYFSDDFTFNYCFNNKHNSRKSSVNIYPGETHRRYYNSPKPRCWRYSYTSEMMSFRPHHQSYQEVTSPAYKVNMKKARNDCTCLTQS